MDVTTRKRILVLAAAAMSSALIPAAGGAVRTWTGSGNNNNFNDASNWGGSLPGDALFSGPPANLAYHSPALTAGDFTTPTAIASLAFDSGGWTLGGSSYFLSLSTTGNGTATYALNFNATGSATGSVTVDPTIKLPSASTATYYINVSSGNTLTLSNAIASNTAVANKISLTGGGTLVLQGSTAPTKAIGDLLITSGTAQLGMTGITAMGGKLIMSGSGSVAYYGDNQVPAAQLYRLDDTSSIDLRGHLQTVQSVSFNDAGRATGAGSIHLGSGTLALTNASANSAITTKASATTATIDADTGGTLQFTGNTALLTVPRGTAAIDLDISARITGINLTKAGTGIVRFSGANTYTGATSVSAGTLLVNGTTSNQGSFSLASGATLGGKGNIGLASAKSLTISAGTVLSPGDIDSLGASTIDTLSVAGGNGVTFTGGTFLVDVAGQQSDKLAVTGNLALGDGVATLSVNGVGSGTYIIASYTGTFTGRFASIPANTQINYGDGSNDVITLTIPEPASLAALGLTALGVLRRRRV